MFDIHLYNYFRLHRYVADIIIQTAGLTLPGRVEIHNALSLNDCGLWTKTYLKTSLSVKKETDSG
jgi:predicted TIM-barrel enzyme